MRGAIDAAVAVVLPFPHSLPSLLFVPVLLVLFHIPNVVCLHPQCVLNRTAAWVRISEAHWMGIIETTVSCGVQDNGVPVVGSLGCKVVVWKSSEGHESIQMMILLCSITRSSR